MDETLLTAVFVSIFSSIMVIAILATFSSCIYKTINLIFLLRTE